MPGLITFFSATMEPNVFVFVSILIDTEISSSLPTHIDDWEEHFTTQQKVASNANTP